MNPEIRFAVNRIAASGMTFRAFAAMAQRLGAKAVEIRNDLADAELTDGTPASQVASIAHANSVEVRSINALQRFEQFDAARAAEALDLARYATESGAQALVLCPTNSRNDMRSAQQRHTDLVHALRQLRPILEDSGLVGLVESLGFEECAVRRKSQAVRAIEEVGATGTFALVHDTFHHHLAGEAAFFPELTGLVHISGVDKQDLALADMRDEHRVLVGPADRLGNIAQLRDLLGAGYCGYVSFEPFAASICNAPDIEQRLAASMAYLSRGVAETSGA